MDEAFQSVHGKGPKVMAQLTWMKDFHIRVALSSQKAHEQHLCEIHLLLHAPQWPNTVVVPTLSREENSK